MQAKSIRRMRSKIGTQSPHSFLFSFLHEDNRLPLCFLVSIRTIACLLPSFPLSVSLPVLVTLQFQINVYHRLFPLFPRIDRSIRLPWTCAIECQNPKQTSKQKQANLEPSPVIPPHLPTGIGTYHNPGRVRLVCDHTHSAHVGTHIHIYIYKPCRDPHTYMYIYTHHDKSPSTLVLLLLLITYQTTTTTTLVGR